MLDQSIKDQLTIHFAALSSSLTLALFRSDHAKQAELRELLADVAACSDKISLTDVAETAAGVQFDILRDGQATGLRFRGVPGGHEFTSLVVALLNADGKGKLPDEGIRRRVRALKGPVRLRTYVSLSCTNCPDVVQALNQMALIHADFRHEMIDGELAEADIEALGIQGVPAVVGGNSIVHVGRANFAELLETLEGALGREALPETAAQPPQRYDVVVLGGGPAGSSAAIYSARKGLKTALVAQKLGGQVEETVGIENLISVPYTEGRRLPRIWRSTCAPTPSICSTTARWSRSSTRASRRKSACKAARSCSPTRSSSPPAPSGASWACPARRTTSAAASPSARTATARSTRASAWPWWAAATPASRRESTWPASAAT
jgi:alkyl hydroperoxide reductase subunit F